MPTEIRFDDGDAYACYMGRWSQLVGDVFLEWMNLPSRLRWLDVGCGNGAFTEQICERCAPVSVVGIDPSDAQLDYARSRPGLRQVEFHRGSAMALPFGDSTFDVAVMPLVLFFVPEPAIGVAELTRVVRDGGSVAAYAWDLEGGGMPYESLHAAIRDLGFDVPTPPHPEASRVDVLDALWRDAGLEHVETCTISVERTFADFADYWTTVEGGASVAALLAAMSNADRASIKAHMERILPVDANGRITCSGWANGVRGQAPQGR